jgi:hypothetical protein
MPFAVLILLFTITAAIAQNNFDREPTYYYARAMNRDQYRKITFDDGGTRYVNLYPLFQYAAAPHGAFAPPSQSPMPHWLPLKIHIIQGATNGVLGRVANQTLPPGNIFIKNYPGAQNLIDGRELYCYAIADGTFTYRNVLGAKTTVPCYNYGHPYNPLGSDPLAGITNLTVIQATTNAPPATAATNRPVRLAPPPQTIFIK